ncbi:MAG: hypothetical protein AB1349_10440 [Elusimicrobiota bacterium]
MLLINPNLQNFQDIANSLLVYASIGVLTFFSMVFGLNEPILQIPLIEEYVFDRTKYKFKLLRYYGVMFAPYFIFNFSLALVLLLFYYNTQNLVIFYLAEIILKITTILIFIAIVLLYFLLTTFAWLSQHLAKTVGRIIAKGYHYKLK